MMLENLFYIFVFLVGSALVVWDGRRIQRDIPTGGKKGGNHARYSK